MFKATIFNRGTSAWLDSLAVGMSMICAVHCLITPVVIGVMPVLATTFWTDQHFHLWMLLLVVPTAAVALFLGCRKHRDRLVVLFGALGLTVLSAVAVYESLIHSTPVLQEHVHCAHCAKREAGNLFTGATAANMVGAVFLTAAHVRNFLLCRQAKCCH